MATLQEQSDAAFRESDSKNFREDRGAGSNSDDGLDLDFNEVQFADIDDDPEGPPPELVYDGKGHKKPTSDLELADDETNPGIQGLDDDEAGVEFSQEPQTQDSHDIHGPRKPAEDIHQQEPEAGSGLSDEMIDRAKQYGVHPAEARATYKTDAELSQAILAHDKKLLEQSLQQRQQPPAPPQPVPPPQQPVPPQPEGQATPPAEPPKTAEQLEWEAYQVQNPDLYDESLLADIQGMSQHHQQMFLKQQQELQAIKQTVSAQQQFFDQQRQAQQQEALRNHVNNFDSSLVELGEDWSDLFGRGAHTDLPQDSAEIFNRSKVLRTFDQLSMIHQQQNRRIDPKAILESSLHINFPERFGSKSSSGQDSQQARDSRGRYTVKPSGNSSGKPGSSLEDTFKKWDKFSGADTEPIDDEF